MLGTMHFYNALLAVIIYSNDSRKPGNRYGRRVDTFPRCQISRYLDFSLIKIVPGNRFFKLKDPFRLSCSSPQHSLYHLQPFPSPLPAYLPAVIVNHPIMCSPFQIPS